MVRYDELELDKIGDRYTALFVMVSDTDVSKNFIAGVLYSQLFQILCRKADNNGGRLNSHTRFLLDDFACIGVIPQFESVIASIRSREISVCVILQNESQIVSRYGTLARNIIGNCDTYIFMGSNELETCRCIAERLDKKASKILNLPIERCIIFSRNNMQCDVKYSLESHHRYRENNFFDYSNLLGKEKPLYINRTRSGDECILLSSVENILKAEKECDFFSKKIANLDVNDLTQDMENDLQELSALLVEMNALDSRCVGNELRNSFFDSMEEEKFYNDLVTLLDKYLYSDFQVDVHVHMNELFTNSMSMLERNKYKYRLVNQHCDFVIRKRDNLSIIVGIEIDGNQHDMDRNQIENDYYKNETFKRNGIPLLRISASQARTNRGWHNKLFDILNKQR